MNAPTKVNPIHVIPARNPYKPRNGDLVCGFEKPESEQYLETPTETKPLKKTRLGIERAMKGEREHVEPATGQVLPLCLVDPNGFLACERLCIDVEPIKVPYECPYTGYTFFAIVPVCLISTDLEEKWGQLIRHGHVARHSPDYVMDHEYHREMWKERVFEIHDINKLLLGSGYTSGTGIWDGSRSMPQTIVNLDNGDSLWVYFWEWHNK